MGVKSVYILNDKEAYGLGVAKNSQGAAKAAGIEVVGFAAYDPRPSSFEALFKKIKGTDPDAVFLGGLIDENSGQLINDKVAVLGPNDGDVKLFLPDGFTTRRRSSSPARAERRRQGRVLHGRRCAVDQLDGHRAASSLSRSSPTLGGEADRAVRRRTARRRRRSCSRRSRHRTATTARRHHEALQDQGRRAASSATSRSPRTATHRRERCRPTSPSTRARTSSRPEDDHAGGGPRRSGRGGSG